MNELQVVIDQKPGVIGFNFEEIRDELQARMDLYKNATFTDEYRVHAKNEVAALRKMKKAIDDKRKEVKNQYMLPYNDFEEKAKELMRIIDQPVNLISQQITEMEERRKAEKRRKIREVYTSLAEGMDYLTLEKIYNSRWENASMNMTAVKKEMEETLSSVKTGVATLEAMASDAVPEALRRYLENLDLAGAVCYVNQYEAQKAEIIRREAERNRLEEEQKRREEEERIRKEERERIEEEKRIREEEQEKAGRAFVNETVRGPLAGGAEDVLPFEQPETVTAFYKVVATPEELEKVEMAFNSIGIYFSKTVA